MREGGERVTAFFSGERHKLNPFDLTPTTYDTTGAGYGRTDAFAKLKYKFTPNFSVGGWAKSYWNQSRGRSRGEIGNSARRRPPPAARSRPCPT
jgi:hypothetical protein